MSKPIIAVDIDDVISDSTDAMRRRVNRRTGNNLEAKHYKVPHEGYWGYYERVWKTHGVNISYDDLAEEMEADQSHVPLLAGASFALSELSRKYELIIITARPESWKAKTKDWLEENLGTIFQSIHFTGDGESKKSKGYICKALGASWLIDDNPEHCQSAIDEGIEVVLFGEYGWHHKAPEHIPRCKDWPAVLEYFNERE